MKRKFKRGEIYYADLSPVIGSEQGGYRPIVILQNNRGNNFGCGFLQGSAYLESKGKQER